MVVRYLIVCLIFQFLLMLSETAHATICEKDPTLKEEVQRSEAIFTGLVLSSRLNEFQRNPGMMITNGGGFIEIEVWKVWKSNAGALPKRILVAGNPSVLVGSPYLFFAYKGEDNQLIIALGRCTRTKQTYDAESDIAELDSILPAEKKAQ